MHKVSARLTLLVVVIASGVAAAIFLRNLDRQASDLTAIEQQLAQRVDRLSDAIAGIGVAQQAYVAPGQRDPQSFERMTALVRQVYDDTAALKPILRSADSENGIQALNAATGNLITADARARENLRIGQESMAADVIFSDGRSTLDAVNQRVRAIRAAEQTFYQSERARLSQQRYTALGVVALGWIAALIMLVRSPRSHSLAVVPIATAPPEPRQEIPVVADPSPTPALDLAAAADLCTALSRLTTTAALPPLLARAAELLDAPGIILWMGAGEELFAVTAHGYRPEIIARLGPIRQDADNATAAAWRTGQPAIVAGDAAGNGAVVTPMFGPDACIGALAVELRHGREHDLATRAVASMIAAQLATVVSAWPAASTARELHSASA